jgi:hypothetical protein
VTPEQERHIKHLWEDVGTTAERIGAMYGVSKNAIVGMANRRHWTARRLSPVDPNSLSIKSMRTPLGDIKRMQAAGIEITMRDLTGLPALTHAEEREYPYARTMMGRLDALHATMDAFIASSRVDGLRLPPEPAQKRHANR